MKLPDELPEGMAVYIAYRVIDIWIPGWPGRIEISNKIRQMHHLKMVLGSYGNNYRIYPAEASIKYTKIMPYEAWNEGMTLAEFEEYIND